jgi:[acyl-carrier-protein] S-malonyltransferase
MEPAVARLERLSRAVSVHDPRTPVISNRDGRIVHDGRDVLDRIVGQIARPVRWDLCLETLSDLGVTGVLELAPGGVLKGLARRSLPGVETVAITSPADLPAARDLVARHAATPSGAATSTADSQETAK